MGAALLRVSFWKRLGARTTGPKIKTPLWQDGCRRSCIFMAVAFYRLTWPPHALPVRCPVATAAKARVRVFPTWPSPRPPAARDLTVLTGTLRPFTPLGVPAHNPLESLPGGLKGIACPLPTVSRVRSRHRFMLFWSPIAAAPSPSSDGPWSRC
jgi:hypothetical protein